MLRFDGKVVFITGASRGIGRHCAIAFAQQGAQVVVHYGSNQEAAETTHAKLTGDNHLIVQADLANPTEIDNMVKSIVDHYGRIDVLVNNAGRLSNHPLPETSYEEWQSHWQDIIGTNLIGTSNVTYCVAHQMIRQKSGRIITISSRTAFRGKPESTAYVASKAGLNAMSQSLALALAPYNIYVGIVAPGPVATDMSADVLETPIGDALKRESPLNRVAKPEEVAYSVLFLASEGAEFLTGSIIDLNGASYLRS